ncbi:hypothetical protein, partial [Nodularia sp. UHCC 0506]|uniref:hypothetical protein n=1 Tax=Nodularia sp. UHCC 0506 TaxID=3110243 RepID=UPI002B213601
MTMQNIQEIVLTFKEGTSNKVYRVYLRKIASELYTVDAAYGKMGSNLKSITKTPNPVSLEAAETIFHRLVNSKI